MYETIPVRTLSDRSGVRQREQFRRPHGLFKNKEFQLIIEFCK